MQEFHDYDPARPFSVSGESHTVTNGFVRLDHTPLKGSVTIAGFTERTNGEPQAGEFYIDYQDKNDYLTATQKVVFNAADEGKAITVDYQGIATILFAKHLNEIKAYMDNNAGGSTGGGGGSGSGTVEDYRLRKANTAYSVGDIVYTSLLTIGKKLVCVRAGTSFDGDLTLPITDDGALATDGSVMWAIDSFADTNYTAAHHNGIYRGANISSYFDSGLFSANVANGIFANIYIGDYIVKTVSTSKITYKNNANTSISQAAATYSNVKWVVGGIDVIYGSSNEGKNTPLTTHHVLVISAEVLQKSVAMNASGSVGYLGTDMWKTHMKSVWGPAVYSAFGSAHVLLHTEVLTGTSSGASFTYQNDVAANIPSATMVYGNPLFASPEDAGNFTSQLPLFRLQGYPSTAPEWFWLRSVNKDAPSYWCIAGGYGTRLLYSMQTATDTSGGIRPYTLLI